jgi:hypothetical protein
LRVLGFRVYTKTLNTNPLALLLDSEWSQKTGL